MIPLAKVECPEVLALHAEEWTDELIHDTDANRLSKPKVRRRYGDATIREALGRETFGKCAYCESKVAHVAYEHVEHILPKSALPGLCYSWENLTIGCPICNTKKSDYFDENCFLVNPYLDDPSDHFLFLGPAILPQGDIRSRVTEARLGLNRTELLERRNERLRSVNTLVNEWKLAAADQKAPLWAMLELEADSTAEYSQFIRSFLRTKQTELGEEES
ncbi:hypothetical protein BH09CHL1_BH09CHL1_09800 [soil metagenome]